MTPDMDGVSWVRVLLASVVVFGLIALMGFGLKYIKMRGLAMPLGNARARRLQIIETLPIDPRRRLIIARCDDAEHLLLLGVNQDLVIETNLDKHRVDFQTKSGA